MQAASGGRESVVPTCVVSAVSQRPYRGTAAVNREQVFTLGQRELERVRAVGQDLAAVMLDIDHFKAINDRAGHPRSDGVLRHVAGQLHNRVRRDDLAGRLGGADFAVVLPAIPAATALRAAERLSSQFADSTVTVDEETIGVAMVRDNDRAIEEALARADAALYTAKGTGRDCVVSCDEVEAVQ